MPNLLQTIIGYPVANAAALTAVDVSNYSTGTLAEVINLGLFWYNESSTATVNNLTVILPSNSNGRWLSLSGTFTTSPVFSANVTSPITNVTGDGTAYNIVFGTAEINTGGNYNISTGIFTAPVTGTYQFNTTISLTGIGAGHTLGLVELNLTPTDRILCLTNPAAIQSPANTLVLSGSACVQLAQSATCNVTLTITGSTKTVGVSSGCWLSGYFIK
jgi:hypothetical protein